MGARSGPCLVLGLLLCLGAPARPAAAASSAARASGAAKKHFVLAMKHYKAEAFQEAIREFQVTYDIEAQPILLYNIAQAHRRLGNSEDAVKYYERFLQEDDGVDTRKKRQVEGLLIEVKAQLAATRALHDAKEQQDRERLSQEQKEKERLAQEQLEKEQLAQAQRAEDDQRERERLAREQSERERLKKDAPRRAELALPRQMASIAVMAPAPAPRRPVHRRWWLWTTVGGAVAVAVAGVVLATSLPASDPFGGRAPEARVPLAF